MKTRRSARAAAAAEAESASRALHASALEVLLCPDLWSQLWRWMDGPSKYALRGVCTELRILVDGEVEVVASPSSGCTGEELSHALFQVGGTHGILSIAVSRTFPMRPPCAFPMRGPVASHA
jgi:hypothetical protein